MYPVYTVALVSGASIQLGSAPPTPIQPNDQRWCTFADAQLILKVFQDLGVADASLVDASKANVNGVTWLNVPVDSPVRPWYLTSSKVIGPVGPALWLQLGPNSINGGGRGNPGHWDGVLTGNPHYVPDVTTVSTTPSVPYDNSKDAGSLAGALGVPTVTFSQSDRDAIQAILKAVTK